MDDLTALDASALSAAIHAGQVSCREVMQATLQRIHALNPRVNAIVSLADDEQLLKQADAHDALLARGQSLGWMHGLPQAIKDTGNAVGFASTFGSPLLADVMPAADSLFVQRMKAAGCIVVGKTNMPEFGLGSHSYNPLFGTTLNAWDPAVSAGGSSGGAAVALALRLLPVADGSDFMGSLRNPAGWNHVIGLRPSQGRVPGWPRPELFVSQLATDGPMGRSVRDVARLLSTQSGHDPRVPLSISGPVPDFVPPPDAGARGLRIGWLGDLGGHLAMEDGVLAVCEQALARLQGGGAAVEPAGLGVDLDALWQAWLLWRRALVAPVVGAALARPGATRERVKPEALWELDQAAGLSCNDFMRAAETRTRFYAQMLTLFQRYDVLALPVAQTWPFAAGETWPRTVAGRAMDTYHRWMEVTIYATFAGLPAISLPAGFHANGRWPMGLQLIGPPQGDAALLHAAQAYENLAAELMALRPQ
ncbi:MAG: amidase [Proteobacteria bacterium]|nr:amidase [Pseudomonadota bacterium]